MKARSRRLPNCRRVDEAALELVDSAGSAAPDSPWQLLRTNGSFARVWAAQLVSFAGDWINFVALVSLLLELTKSGMAVSFLIVANTLPLFLVAPLAGVVADRFDRRKIMIAADLSRAVLVLCFLLIAPTRQAWIAYPVAALSVAIAAFFGPASSAAIPNLVRPSQLVAANALASASWGTMLAIGAGLGGVISAHFGRQSAFLFDSLSFLISAMLVSTVRVPFSARRPHEAARSHDGESPWQHFVAALRYVRQHRSVLALLLIKTCWGMGGGIITLLSVIPFAVLHAGDAGVGMVYSFRGMGAVVGPICAHWLSRGRPRHMAVTAALGVVCCGFFYTAYAMSPTLALAAACVFLAHLGGGAQWVLSTSLLQRVVDDSILGRISALDIGGITLTMTVSTLFCGWGIQAMGARPVGVLMGAIVMVTGSLWLLWYGLLRPAAFEPVGGGEAIPTALLECEAGLL